MHSVGLNVLITPVTTCLCKVRDDVGKSREIRQKTNKRENSGDLGSYFQKTLAEKKTFVMSIISQNLLPFGKRVSGEAGLQKMTIRALDKIKQIGKGKILPEYPSFSN